MNDLQLRVLQIEVAVVALLLSGIAIVLSYVSARISIRNKQIDAIFHDHKRFDDLQVVRWQLKVAEAGVHKGTPDAWSEEKLGIEASSFFDRFWSLQFDAYIAWFDGYIPTSMYTYWLFSRWRELREPSDSWTIAKRTLATSLEEVSARWKRNPDKTSSQSIHVNSFLDMMKFLSANETVDMKQLLRDYGPGRTRHIIGHMFGRY